MVGLDGDTPETFARTLQFLVDNKVTFLKLFTPCPYPGTKYHDDMVKAGRLLDGNWARYDYGSAADPADRHDVRADDGRLQVRLRGLLLGTEHRCAVSRRRPRASSSRASRTSSPT